MESYIVFILLLGLYAICFSVCTIVEFLFGKDHFYPSYFKYKALIKIYYPNHKCTYKEYKFMFLPKLDSTITNSFFSAIDSVLTELKEDNIYENKK